MAHSKQARKRIRTATQANLHKRPIRTRLRTYIKSTLKAIAEGNKEAAQTLSRQAAAFAQRCAGKKISHKKTAARIAKRLNAGVIAISKS